MKNLFTKNIWAVACLSCLVFIGTSCNESIDVEAVYITAAEKTPITTFSATNNNDELGITISSSLVANSNIEGELMMTIRWWNVIIVIMGNLTRHYRKVLVCCQVVPY